jgi:hypothetical protein
MEIKRLSFYSNSGKVAGALLSRIAIVFIAEFPDSRVFPYVQENSRIPVKLSHRFIELFIFVGTLLLIQRMLLLLLLSPFVLGLGSEILLPQGSKLCKFHH